MKHKHLVSLTLLILMVVLGACAANSPAPTSTPPAQNMPATPEPTTPPSAMTAPAEALITDAPPATQASVTPTSLSTRTSTSTPEPATSTATPTQIPTSTEAPQPFDPTTLSLGLEQIANGLDAPVFATHAGDGSGRLFVVEKKGQIRVLDADGLLSQPFLDIRKRVGSGSSEQGLLGLAFHPNFAQNGRLFVYYTDKQGNTVISRFQANTERTQVDPDSEVVLLTQEQPAANHNGGMLAFGPDGMLYAGLGDGGKAGDPWGNGQNLDTLLGKLLRIDVDGGQAVAVPAGNPFAGQEGAKGEIWAYGLRNPWRFSFDRATGDLWIGDVGQNQWEEIDYQPAASSGGENYGWDLMEGTHCYEADTCDRSGLVLPVAEYNHGDNGCSVTGGYVYRGKAEPSLQGVYFYGDYCSGRIWGLARDASGEWQSAQPLDTDLQISSFGETEEGDLLVVDLNGSMYRLVKD